MRWIIRIVGGLFALALLLVGGLAGSYLMVREPVPDLAKADHAEVRIALAPEDVVAKASRRLAKVRQDLGHHLRRRGEAHQLSRHDMLGAAN